uniref:Mannosyltransferase n=1 Tax=Lynceus sp. MCZ IZ 141354 TaxID=1930659 RepID=A0A9N6WVP5_9CRUS|nr:EOG090X04MD [Lynceus sp. MCZ IZ 141354]
MFKLCMIFCTITSIWNYDHHDFPGVVPRTFIGSFFVSYLASPLVFLFRFLDVRKLYSLYIVRGILGLMVVFCFRSLQNTVKEKLGPGVSNWMMLITISQFHFMFYCSRPLPNIMAMPLVLLAISSWIRGQHSRFIFSAGIAVLIFRSELMMLLGLPILIELASRRLHFKKLLKVGIVSGVSLILTTVLLDSFFWMRWLWPEGEVFYFNTILNKSSDWGTLPFFWYFYSAIPRAMLLSVVLVPVGAYLESRIRMLVFICIAFVMVYSLLPHKELRFILYVVPLLNIAAACAADRWWTNRFKGKWQGLLALCAALHLIINGTATVFLLLVSSWNYPGGVALATFHALVDPGEPYVNIHIDNLAAQTGITRFGELNSHWSYNKSEDLKPGSEEMFHFTHLIIEAKNRYSRSLKPYSESHEVLAVIEGFSHTDLQEDTNTFGEHYVELEAERVNADTADETSVSVGFEAGKDAVEDKVLDHEVLPPLNEDLETNTSTLLLDAIDKTTS